MNMMTAMPTRVMKSMKMVSDPEPNISLIASMSVLMRLTSRPIGVRSKNAIGSCSTR